MSTSQEVRDPDHEWLGCEAMLSVPPFGLMPAVPAQPMMPSGTVPGDPEADAAAR